MSPEHQHVRLAFTTDEARARTNGERRWDGHPRLWVRSDNKIPN